ncbi:hypothetical protein RJ45_15825 [Photobacterium gaetbulicola]|uniref:DUF1456 domain-containing protein n=1 Tax=Photobacterium gaetbulicola TaxID=1295392 RepID=A0A0B9GVL8_9GAMM|nr:DUF1456 family protein [Photobacterium gaetbulicola]KHT62741.1 hypothetical protein RJ45_15825 [Photobacterium gaetbulicola]
MLNNDILRRLRYTFDFSDTAMIDIFAAAEHEVSRELVSDWLKREGEPAFKKCTDRELAIFLNGLINVKRGKREGPQPEPESRLTNNMIFMKLRIALNYKAEDILEILESVNFRMSQHELSAFFRKPDNKHYRECKDQILRNFLLGVQYKIRP